MKLPEYEVEADDGLWLRRLVAVEDGGLRFSPDETATVGQESVLAGDHLTFRQHCRHEKQTNKKKTTTYTNI